MMTQRSTAYLFLTTLWLLSSVPLHGQETSDVSEEKALKKEQRDAKKEEKQSKKRKSFKLYGGITGSTIAFKESRFESALAAGYDLGVSYRKGRFTSWEVGLRYMGSAAVLEEPDNPNPITDKTFGIHQLELPIAVGINLLAPVQRIIGIRAFGGISPGVIVNVADNPLDISEDDVNTFQLGGNIGVGVDVLFLFLEAGYNRGFTDIFKEGKSKLSQVYLNLGVRF